MERLGGQGGGEGFLLGEATEEIEGGDDEVGDGHGGVDLDVGLPRHKEIR